MILIYYVCVSVCNDVELLCLLKCSVKTTTAEREGGLWRVLPNVQGLLVLLVSSEQWRS